MGEELAVGVISLLRCSEESNDQKDRVRQHLERLIGDGEDVSVANQWVLSALTEKILNERVFESRVLKMRESQRVDL